MKPLRILPAGITDIDNPHEVPLEKILLTSRHHACEAVANYVLEGVLESILTGNDAAWFAKHADVLAIPFVDTDGVEQGDQGKNRRPRPD